MAAVVVEEGKVRR